MPCHLVFLNLSSIPLITFAGMSPTIGLYDMTLATTTPDATTAFSPMVTHGNKVA